MDELETLDPFEKMLQEEQRAQEALATRYKALQSSLERRVNMPFDPRLMRVATALLSPTKSGTTGESIGMAAGALLDESEKDALRQRETLKMQAELEERMLEMKRQGLGLQALQRLRPGEKPTDPTKPTVPTGMPMGGIGVQIAPADPGYMPDRDYAAMLYSSGKKPGEIMEAIEKRRRENIEVREGGVYNKAEGTFYATPKGDVVEKFPVQNPDTGRFENYSVPSNIAARLSQLQLTNPEAYKSAVRQFVFGQPAETAPAMGMPSEASVGAAPSITAGVTGVKRPTVGQQAAEQGRQEALSKARGEEEGEEIKSILRSAREADAITQQARSLKTLASDPNADQIFGILSRPNVASAIGKLVETGIGANQFRIGIPELQTALTQAGLNEQEMAKYQTALQLMTEFQLKMSQYVKGAVSNYEQGLFAKASINPNDRPQTIMMKANAAILMSDFARKKAALFDRMNTSVNEFRASPEYQRLLDETNDKMTQVLSGKDIQQRSSRPGGITSQDIEAEMRRRGLK